MCGIVVQQRKEAFVQSKSADEGMKKAKIGVVGGYRGTAMINYCKIADNAEIVAICDNNKFVLDKQKELCKDYDVTFYDNFNDFIKHDMDAVVLANFANEHAPFAIAAMKAGKHVLSEVLPVQTMKEAVELVECVEETGMIYAYSENYCYMAAPYEMKKLYEKGRIGEFEYGECEYIYNCEPIWSSITYGDRDHWRNNMYSTFYCTHSLGPIIHATKLRPVKVSGFESTMNERSLRMGAKAGSFGIEMVTLENGGIIKSIHGGLYKDSIWYSMYGSKGRMESAREDARCDDVGRIYVNCDEYSGEYKNNDVETYKPTRKDDEKSEGHGHRGGDYYAVWNFAEKLLGNPEADTIDVYEALDMFLPGMFAYRSILDGGVPKDIPNLRNREERDIWRNDTACTVPSAAGDMLLPTCVSGTPDIDDKVYEAVRKKYETELKEESDYMALAFHQGDVESTK